MNYLKSRICFVISLGYIIGVVKPTHWILTDLEKNVGRWEFEGEEILDSLYLHMQDSHIIRKR